MSGPTDAEIAAMDDEQYAAFIAGAVSAARAEADFFNNPPYHDLTDAEIINAVQLYKGRDLWCGRHVGDHSQADMALCNELARWCGPDPERIDALFRESGLYRGKWEREDYRRRTIAKACCRASFIGWDQPVPRGVRARRAS